MQMRPRPQLRCLPRIRRSRPTSRAGPSSISSLDAPSDLDHDCRLIEAEKLGGVDEPGLPKRNSPLATAVSHYQNQYFPKGVAKTTYPDLGDTQGYQGLITEEDGFVLAFNSLIDPSPTNRIKYAQYARNLVMVAMNEAAKGVLADAPFRDPAFPDLQPRRCCRSSVGLIVDWIYNATDASNKPILTTTDKATIRKVFMIWANECLNASTTGGDHPEPIGAMNNFSLIGGRQSGLSDGIE